MLQKILARHALWLADSTKGKCADLSRTNLSGVDLFRANLFRADLSNANLSYANLSYANLSRTNLSGANLSSASLIDANLSGADLSGANLSRANLSHANLFGADLLGANLIDANLIDAKLPRTNLSGVDLSRANLFRADLSGADLSRANLSNANLSRTNLSGADLTDVEGLFPIVPEIGAFVGFKKLKDGKIATLLIPADAGRVGGYTGRKCRAQRAYVLSIEGAEYGQDFSSQFDLSFLYRIGKEIIPEEWDSDPRVECAEGIHFFITLQEAKDYK